MAAKFNITLIFYGEMPGEYGRPISHKEKKFSNSNNLQGYQLDPLEGKDFKGNEGKNTQLILGKDLFIKGFDDQLIGVKKNDSKKVEVKLPENFPEKHLVNKKAIFVCNITNVKINHEVKVDDEFAKSLGAKDLNGLKELISKQINDEYK